VSPNKFGHSGYLEAGICASLAEEVGLKSNKTVLHLTAAGLADPDFIHNGLANYLGHFKFGLSLWNKTIQTALLPRAVTFFFRVRQSKNKT